MKERPIIYNTEMVKATLEGRKAQTRRVIKPPKEFKVSEFDFSRAWIDKGEPNWDYIHLPVKRFDEPDWSDDRWCRIFCPHGQVGDRMWVKETLYRNPYFDEAGYIADNSPVMVNQTIGDTLKWRWKRDILPAIFMPREASRITLEITEVRVERLQEITQGEIRREGIKLSLGAALWAVREENILRFARLWDSINTKHPWESNPWVWVISFRRI